MAYTLPNDKGFKVIAFTSQEMVRLTGNPYPICDSCSKSEKEGYYIAVLNQWMCRECMEEWYERSKNYPEDREIEERNYYYYLNLARERGLEWK